MAISSAREGTLQRAILDGKVNGSREHGGQSGQRTLPSGRAELPSSSPSGTTLPGKEDHCMQPSTREQNQMMTTALTYTEHITVKPL